MALDDEPVRLTEIVREPGRLALALELSQEPSATGMQSLAAAGFPQVGDRLLGCCDPVWPGRIALAWPGADPGVASKQTNRHKNRFIKTPREVEKLPTKAGLADYSQGN